MLESKFIYSLLTSPDLDIFLALKECYFSKEYQKYLNFIQEFYRENREFPELNTVQDEFDIDFTENSESLSYWNKRLIDAYKEEIIIDAVKEAAKTKDIQVFQNAIKLYTSEGGEDSAVHYGKGMEQRFDNYQKLKEQDGISYLPTGSDILDYYTNGYYKTDLVLIGGEENIGKTWFWLRRANDLAKILHLFSDRPILCVSGEMGSDELVDRVDSINAQVSYRKFLNATLSEKEEKRLKMFYSMNKNRPNPIIFEDSPQNINDIRRLIQIYRPAAVFADSIHVYAKSFDWRDLMTLNQELKSTTRTEQVPLICTTHLKDNEGTDIEDANIRSFAYFKAARAVDVAWVMIQNPELEVLGKIALKQVKARKTDKVILMTHVDRNSNKETIQVYEDTEEED